MNLALFSRISAFRVAGLVTLVLATGCSSRASAPSAPSTGEFVVQPGDQLRIAVWPDNEMGLSGEYTVENDGLVHLPLLGAVEVANRTLGDVRELLRNGYGEFMQQPVLQITPVFPVSVLGAVNRPGLYHITPTETLFDVISLAGGFAAGADQDDIRIVRSPGVIEIDATDAIHEPIDLSLRSGDRIMVPADRWNIGARDILFALQSVALVLTLTERLGN